MTDPYEILEISAAASQEEIKNAYHSLARRWHPDQNLALDQNLASEKMKVINEAWDLIGSESKRIRFDASRNELPVGVKIDRSHYSPVAQTLVREQTQHLADEKRKSLFLLAPFIVAVLVIAGIVISSTLLPDEPGVGNQLENNNLGAGIDLGDCVNIMQGPSLIEVPCTENVDGVVVGARSNLDTSGCVAGTNMSIRLSSGVLSCLR